jgi:Tfp pilus assembly protein PilF
LTNTPSQAPPQTTLADLLALARHHAQAGNLREAEHLCRLVLRLRPDCVLAYHALAMVYVQDEQRLPAEECFQHLLRLEPSDPIVHGNYGAFLLEEGRRAEALEHYREALRWDPHCVPALAAVAGLGLYPLDDGELARMRSLLRGERLSADERARLHFALGNHYDRTGAFDEAFSHFERANALRRGVFLEAGRSLEPERHRARIDRIIATCDASYFQRTRAMGRDSGRPAFIVGMPRSGTSLVEQILASHPEVFGGGELKDVQSMAESLPARLGITGTGYPDCLASLDAATARALADQYLRRIGRHSGQAARVTDKMPTNFEHLGFIAALFPQARVIHCVRDPRDVCLSCYFQDFRSMNFAWDLEVLGEFYGQYERLMAHWGRVLPLPMLEVAYEELVADPEAVSRRLVAFCGQEWSDACLTYHENPRAVRTVSLLQVRQPVYQSSIGRWRHYEAHLQPLLRALACGKARM